MERPQRHGALTALVSIGEPAVPRLIQLLEHDDHAVATSASVALNRIGRPAVPALARAIQKGDQQVVIHTASALWWIGPGAKDAMPVLLDIAGSADRSDASRLAAIRAAMKIDPTVANDSAVLSSIPVLIRVLGRGNFREQGEAAHALGTIGPPARAALPLLRVRAKPPSKDVDTHGLVEEYVQNEANQAIAAIEQGGGSTQPVPKRSKSLK